MRRVHTAELRLWVYSTLFKTPIVSYRDPIMQKKHVNIMLLTTDEIFGDTDDNNYFSILDASSKFLQLLWWNEEENCVHSVLPLANRPFNSRVLYFLMFFIMKHNIILKAKRYKAIPRSYFCLDRWEGRQRRISRKMWWQHNHCITIERVWMPGMNVRWTKIQILWKEINV